jgi:hypothetical protein
MGAEDGGAGWRNGCGLRRTPPAYLLHCPLSRLAASAREQQAELLPRGEPAALPVCHGHAARKFYQVIARFGVLAQRPQHRVQLVAATVSAPSLVLPPTPADGRDGGCPGGNGILCARRPVPIPDGQRRGLTSSGRDGQGTAGQWTPALGRSASRNARMEAHTSHRQFHDQNTAVVVAALTQPCRPTWAASPLRSTGCCGYAS